MDFLQTLCDDHLAKWSNLATSNFDRILLPTGTLQNYKITWISSHICRSSWRTHTPTSWLIDWKPIHHGTYYNQSDPTADLNTMILLTTNPLLILGVPSLTRNLHATRVLLKWCILYYSVTIWNITKFWHWTATSVVTGYNGWFRARRSTPISKVQ